METLKERLNQFDGQPEQAWNARRSVSVGERGQKYSVNFSTNLMSAVYSIDGGIIKDQQTVKCDKLILVERSEQNWFELFVELKGVHISHAINQMEETLKNSLFNDSSVVERQARIIGRRIPRNTGNSITEKAKKKFLKIYQCRLEFKNGPATEKIKLD